MKRDFMPMPSLRRRCALFLLIFLLHFSAPFLVQGTSTILPVFVTNWEESSVAVITNDTHLAVGDIRVGRNPYAIATSPAANSLAVANMGDLTLSFIDLTGFSAYAFAQPNVATIDLSSYGEPLGLVYSIDATQLFVITTHGYLLVVDLPSLPLSQSGSITPTIHSVAVSLSSLSGPSLTGYQANDVTIDPVTGALCLLYSGTPSYVVVLDSSSYAPLYYSPVIADATAMIITPAQQNYPSYLFVSSIIQSHISYISSTDVLAGNNGSAQLINLGSVTLPVVLNPLMSTSMTTTPDGSTLYIADLRGYIIVVDLTQGLSSPQINIVSVLYTLSSRDSAAGILYQPANSLSSINQLFVASPDADTVIVWDASSLVPILTSMPQSPTPPVSIIGLGNPSLSSHVSSISFQGITLSSTVTGSCPEKLASQLFYQARTLLAPPASFSALRLVHDNALYYEIYDALRWQASPSSNVVGYHLYQGSQLIATLGAATLSYEIHNLPRNGAAATYQLASIDSNGHESAYVSLSL